MGRPSAGDVRGQRDTVGYPATREAMAKAWHLSAEGPEPESLGGAAPPGVLGVLGPHDDYIYAARVYRRVFPLVTARTVVIVGVFHSYRRFGERDRFSVTLGTMLVGETARALGDAPPRAVPLVMGTSVDTPELALRDVGLGPTAPANLYHFVTHPAIAYVAGD